jgi:hypothetical protein
MSDRPNHQPKKTRAFMRGTLNHVCDETLTSGLQPRGGETRR